MWFRWGSRWDFVRGDGDVLGQPLGFRSPLYFRLLGCGAVLDSSNGMKP